MIRIRITEGGFHNNGILQNTLRAFPGKLVHMTFGTAEGELRIKSGTTTATVFDPAECAKGLT